jgi:hypothetical protein
VRDNSEIGQFTRQLEARARDIQMALPSGISPAKFQRTSSRPWRKIRICSKPIAEA